MQCFCWVKLGRYCNDLVIGVDMGKLKAGILGGTGYTGIELLRILGRHPAAELSCITSRSESGRPVADLFPSLRGVVSLDFTDPGEGTLESCDVVFCATPNGVAMQLARSLLAAGVRIIDLSADFRLKDVAEWERWYGMTHACPDLVQEAVYGLPELCRETIREARLVANPGCYPTSVLLGFLPLVEAGVVRTDRLIADAKSGVSGAGRSAKTDLAFCEAGDSFRAYGVPGHRHHPEIRQGLGQIAGHAVGLVFTPHLVPMIRGIHATLYAQLDPIGETDLQALYENRYAGEPFVDVMPQGSHPDTRSVRGSNTCRIAVHRPLDGDTVVVLAVEDNLVKGAAGQAVQNMNLMFGLDETDGLDRMALVP